jgi:hypothetical protein
MPTLPTPAPTPIPSEPSTVRVLDEDEGLALESQQGSDHSSNESGSDSNDGSDSEGPSDVDDLGSESETEEHVVDMEGT